MGGGIANCAVAMLVDDMRTNGDNLWKGRGGKCGCTDQRMARTVPLGMKKYHEECRDKPFKLVRRRRRQPASMTRRDEHIM
jgi:hypothetical protein